MSSKGMPSLMALLGLAAVAGYQNRDKIGDMLRGGGGADPATPAGTPAGAGAAAAGSGGLLGEIGQMFGGGGGAGAGGSGGNLSEGLGELMNRFRTAGHGASADSWVSKDANADLHPDHVEQALGKDTIDELAAKTGLSSAEIVKRLATALPQTVDSLTPDGRLPS